LKAIDTKLTEWMTLNLSYNKKIVSYQGQQIRVYPIKGLKDTNNMNIILDQNENRMNGSTSQKHNRYDQEIKGKISLQNKVEIIHDYECGDSQKWKIFDDHIIYMKYYDADGDDVANEVWTKVNKNNPRIKQSIIVPGYAT
jgi:hypothetical protein